MNRVHLSVLLATLAAYSIASGCGEGSDPDYMGGTNPNTATTGGGFPTTGGLTGGPGATGAAAGLGATTGAAAGVGATPGAGAVTGATPGGGATTAGGGLPGAVTPGVPGAVAGGATTGALGGLLGGGRTGALGGLFGGLTGGLTGGGAGGTTGGSTMLPPVTGGSEPTIPAIKGDCPEFKNGTVMVAGHKAIQLTVGQANKMGSVYFFWHGTGGNAAQVSMVPASVRNEVVSSGGIIASFNGNSSSGTGGDCSGTGAHNKADFDAADQIVACAVKNHGVDAKRIYTTGCSAGGLQSGCMAMMRSGYIAASAPNSGGVVFPEQWQNAGKPAIFTMHGGDSDWVIITFSESSATLDMAAKQHGSFVVNCNHGGGHCGAPAALYAASWEFMKDHPYGVDSPWKSGIPTNKNIPNYCKIY